MRRTVALLASALVIAVTNPQAHDALDASWAKAASLAREVQREAREGHLRAAAGFPKPNIDKLQQALEQHIIASVDAYGYPRGGSLGQASVEAFWLALDECRPAFRQAQLPKLEALFDAGFLDGPKFAQFIDALLIEQGKPQRFGTVVLHQGDALVLAPTADRATLDERRQRYGLLPLASYMALMERLHNKRFTSTTPPVNTGAPPTPARPSQAK